MPYANAYELEKRRIDEQAYIQGLYFMEALKATVVNMFTGKSSEKFEYPVKPMYMTEIERENEIKKGREEFLAKLKVMQTNFELNKKAKEVEKNEHSSSIKRISKADV